MKLARKNNKTKSSIKKKKKKSYATANKRNKQEKQREIEGKNGNVYSVSIENTKIKLMEKMRNKKTNSNKKPRTKS